MRDKMIITVSFKKQGNAIVDDLNTKKGKDWMTALFKQELKKKKG